MKINDIIHESIDPSSAYEIVKYGFKNGAWRAYAYDDDYKPIQIVIIPAGIGDCYIEFRRDGRVDITGGGDAYSILATVISAFKLFLDENPAPEKIIFTADEQSRQKLYRRLIKKFAPEFGYEIDRDRGHVVQLKRKEEEKQKEDDKETLTEAATDVLFHYVNAAAAADILRQGYFDMENAIGKEAEEEFTVTTGEYIERQKRAAQIIAQHVRGLTMHAYLSMVDAMIDGTEEQREHVRYSLRRNGMLPSEIEKLERLLAPRPRTFLPYFFATTRSRLGDYHKNPTKNAVLFTLDGRALMNARTLNGRRIRLAVRPVDYWKAGHKNKESEDRVFTDHPTLPIQGIIRSIDMYLGDDLKGITDEEYDAYRDSEARQVIKLAQEQGIPINFYRTSLGWKTRLPKDRVDVETVLSNMKPEPEHRSSRESTLGPDMHLSAWWEFIRKSSTADLFADSPPEKYEANNKRAREILHNYIIKPWSNREAVSQLRPSFHNAPLDKRDQQTAIQIVNWMIKKKLKSTGELYQWLKNKWKKILEQENETK